jgi:hypothetical protein
VPADGSPPDLIVRMLDGLGVNYNTATSMDALHAKYPGTFFFCSEISSETSTRGFYQDPGLLNTGENYTPGKRNTSSYDNNLASWCMSGEYELKKARDRLFWTGSFLWAGQDYIGEPTPYDVFPVKASFFGAADTAGFAKDAYHLYRSQWAAEPVVHIVPMDWTSWAPGSPVSVWVYANVPTVELFLNGRSLGARSFDRKVTTFGLPYLQPGRIQVTVTSPGLAAATITLRAAAPAGAAPSIAGTGTAAAPLLPAAAAPLLPAAAAPLLPAAAAPAGGAGPAADASYSGAPATIPAMMLDGNLSTGWSNYYDKAQTANLPAVSSSRAGDWVSLSWPSPRRLGSLAATFTTGGPLALPASAEVSYWDGHALVPVRNLRIAWATGSNQPTTLTFDPVSTSQLRLTMTGRSPGTAAGFLMIAELRAS